MQSLPALLAPFTKFRAKSLQQEAYQPWGPARPSYAVAVVCLFSLLTARFVSFGCLLAVAGVVVVFSVPR